MEFDIQTQRQCRGDFHIYLKIFVSDWTKHLWYIDFEQCEWSEDRSHSKTPWATCDWNKVIFLFAFEINNRGRRVFYSSVLALHIPRRPKFGLQTIFQDPPFQILPMVGLMQSLCYHLHTRPTFCLSSKFAFRGRCIKKSKKKLTSVSFTYVCVAENAELLFFFYFFFAPSP